MKEIRTLEANEIDCRVGMVSQRTKKVSILLYKNARVDMTILDELVGPENWQRDHKEIKGNLYCGVGINTAQGWVWKWDCGVESNTEKEKGEASDSFKRACVNWGIGRELYTAPAIWIDCNDKEWNDGKPYVDFRVSHIAYKDRVITELEIVDRTGTLRYHYGLQKSTPANKGAKKAVSAPAQEETKGIMTPEQFKKRWDSDETGGGITFDDIAECAKAWGLCSNPRIRPIDTIKQMVLQKAGIEDSGLQQKTSAKKPKIFCPEDYPVAWNSAVKRAKETGDITRLDIEDRGFVVTPENWERFTKAINS